ncbi:hypothetical protein HPB51_005002 [Rhipicephalus microplus]|uniref:Uncharacterized protein n=1 Tax=Rhipicephalus microplus TaxID=6941 RepID=A0A9J6DKP0_RHIMP|nr:hypothetical protein HPB51_005002 [Rhipicephalus microplus]
MPNESVMMYVEDMTGLFRRADLDMAEEKKVRHLTRGVKEQLFAGLVPCLAKTLAEFSTEAPNMEEVLCSALLCTTDKASVELTFTPGTNLFQSALPGKNKRQKRAVSLVHISHVSEQGLVIGARGLTTLVNMCARPLTRALSPPDRKFCSFAIEIEMPNRARKSAHFTNLASDGKNVLCTPKSNCSQRRLHRQSREGQETGSRRDAAARHKSGLGSQQLLPVARRDQSALNHRNCQRRYLQISAEEHNGFRDEAAMHHTKDHGAVGIS